MTKTKYIHFTIMVALTFLIAFAPPISGITPQGMKTLGVFVAVLYGWIAFDLIIPSVYGFAALSLLGLMPTTKALAAGLGNVNLVVTIVALVFAGALSAVGVTKVVANWLLCKKILRKSPWLLVIGILFISYISGMLAIHMAMIFLLWGVIFQIAEKNNIPRGDKLITFMVLMIVVTGFNGIFAVPFRASAIIFSSYFVEAMGTTFPLIPFIIICVATTGTLTIVMTLVGKFIFRLDAAKFVLPDEIVEEIKNEEITKEAKAGFVVMIVYTLALVMPALWPTMPGAATLNSLGVAGVSCLGLIVLAVISFQGKSLIEMGQAWSKYMDWQIVLLLAITYPLADAMRASETGIMSTIMQAVVPIVSDMGVVTFMVVSIVALGILTQFTHNIVLAAMFTPFLCPLCEQIGGNPYVMWFLMYIILNASYATPAASMQSALVHGHSMINKKYAYIFGTTISVVTLIILFCITLPLGNMLF